jgi:hypothetical protein
VIDLILRREVRKEERSGVTLRFLDLEFRILCKSKWYLLIFWVEVDFGFGIGEYMFLGHPSRDILKGFWIGRSGGCAALWSRGDLSGIKNIEKLRLGKHFTIMRQAKADLLKGERSDISRRVKGECLSEILFLLKVCFKLLPCF